MQALAALPSMAMSAASFAAKGIGGALSSMGGGGAAAAGGSMTDMLSGAASAGENGFAGGTAASASQAAALGSQALSTGLTMAGQGAQGGGGLMMNLYQAKVAKNNADFLAKEAVAARANGVNTAAMDLMQGGERAAAQKAAMAANGLEANFGSAQQVQDATHMEADWNARVARYQADRQAIADTIEAHNQKAQAAMSTMAGIGDLIGSGFKMGQSFIGGAASAARMRSQFQLASGDN